MGGCSSKEFREGTAKEGAAHVTRTSALQRQATKVIVREHKNEDVALRKESMRNGSMRRALSLRQLKVRQNLEKHDSKQHLLEHQYSEIMSTACPDAITDAVGGFTEPSEFTSGNMMAGGSTVGNMMADGSTVGNMMADGSTVGNMKADGSTFGTRSLAYSLPDGSQSDYRGGSMAHGDDIFSSCESNSVHLECESRSLSATSPLNVNNYEIVRKVDAGRFSVIWKARPINTPESSNHFAIKILAPRAMENTNLKELATEMVHMLAVDHENVVSLQEMLLDPVSLTCWMIQELVVGTNLRRLIMANHGSGFPEDTCQSILIQLAKGLSAIHSAGIIHGGIACDNIILTQTGVIKICDFGQSREHHSKIKILKEGEIDIEKRHYSAPELKNPEISNPDGVKTDVYAAGVVLFLCLTAKFPFKNGKTTERCSPPPSPSDSCGSPTSMRMRKLHSGTSLEAASLLSGMLDPSHVTRSNLLQVTAHPWVGAAVPLVTTRIHHHPSLKSEKSFALTRLQAWYRDIVHDGSPRGNNPLDEGLGNESSEDGTLLSTIS